MSSKQSTLLTTLRRKSSGRRTPPPTTLKTTKPRLCKPRKTFKSFVNGEKQPMGVSEKLEALKNLIPARNEEMKADELFEETADYIVFLKTQVEVLQRLIDLYGSNEQQQKVVQ